jgi:hypothetical protein
MKTERWMSSAATFLFGFAFCLGTAQAQVAQAELAQRVTEGGLQVRYGAALQVLDMGPENADAVLRDALVSAFAKEAEAMQAYRRGEAPMPDLSTIGALATVVGEFRDPRAIESFMDVLGYGPAIARGIAAFGEPAVPYLVEAARTGMPERGGEFTAVVTDALIALRFLAEGVGQIPLSPSSRQELIAVARERLEPKQSSFSFLFWATDLAYVLGDPELMQVVEAMAADPSEVASRLENPSEWAVEEVSAWAKARLSGEPPLPRWHR